MTNIADGAPSLSSYLDWIYPIFTQRNPAKPPLEEQETSWIEESD